MELGEITIDFSPIALTEEFVMGELAKRVPAWLLSITKLGSSEADAALFQILTLMRSLGFVAQDLLTVKGDLAGAANVGAMLSFMQAAFEKQLNQVMPVENEE
jgi:hypothetical protein